MIQFPASPTFEAIPKQRNGFRSTSPTHLSKLGSPPVTRPIHAHTQKCSRPKTTSRHSLHNSLSNFPRSAPLLRVSAPPHARAHPCKIWLPLPEHPVVGVCAGGGGKGDCRRRGGEGGEEGGGGQEYEEEPLEHGLSFFLVWFVGGGDGSGAGGGFIYLCCSCGGEVVGLGCHFFSSSTGFVKIVSWTSLDVTSGCAGPTRKRSEEGNYCQ